jgi:hypothetical protein
MKTKIQLKHSRKAHHAKPQQIEVAFAKQELNQRICLIVNAACAARGGSAGMTLSDWREVEADLTQKLANPLETHRCRPATSPARPCRVHKQHRRFVPVPTHE